MRIIFSLLNIILVLVLIASVNFAVFRTYGDGSWLIPRGGPPGLSEELREELRLDEHLVIQYFDYLASTFTCDFYTSTSVRGFFDVETLIYHSILSTLFLLVIVSTTSILLGMVWGSCMRKNAKNLRGRFLHVLAVSSLSFPVFALMLSLVMTVDYLDRDFPIWGNGFDEGVVGALQHAILPTLSLIVAGSGFFALITRAGLLRAERLGEKMTPFKALDYVNPFPYYLFPLVLIGILVVDIMYRYDGLGTLISDAYRYRDILVLMACFFVISVIIFFSQLAFRAVRERSRFMHPIDGILGPAEGTGSHIALDLRRDHRERLSISLLVSESKKLAGAYRRHKPGVAAVIILAVFLVMGLFADVLSTVSNPWYIQNHEPNVIEDGVFVWINPSPPSLTESPAGFLHPLGTDHLGRDLYSMNLYAAGHGVATVLWTCAISVLCGLFVGFLSIVSAHYMGLMSRLGKHSMVIVSQLSLIIPASSIMLLLLVSPHRVQVPPIEFLLILSIYCWVYRTITWPLSNSLRSVTSVGRWNETGRILRDSLSLFRCYSPLVLSKTLHVTKYIVVLMFVFSSSFFFFRATLFHTSLSWDSILQNAYSFGAFSDGSWWWIVPPLLGIVALAVSSYFFIDTLERVFDEQVEAHTVLEQPREETPGSDSDVALGQIESEPEVSTPTTESSE